MRVSLIQSSIEWLAPQLNWQMAEEQIAKCAGSSLVALPEMFATGFCLEPARAVADWQQTVEWMERMAAKYAITIAGSVAVENDGRHYNRLYVVGADGVMTHYDKRHLFSFAGEDRHYDRGAERVVVEIEGVKVLLQICYDLRFPVAMRNCGDYDMILCVANWPQQRRIAWDTLLRARAIENLAYVCGVNIVGDDPTSHYSGGTMAIDFRGDTLAQVADGRCGIATFEVDIEALRRFRGKFPALDDADDFKIV